MKKISQFLHPTGTHVAFDMPGCNASVCLSLPHPKIMCRLFSFIIDWWLIVTLNLTMVWGEKTMAYQEEKMKKGVLLVGAGWGF